MITDYNKFRYNIDTILENFSSDKIDNNTFDEQLYNSLEISINENIFSTLKGNVEDWFMKIMAYVYNNAKKLKDKLLKILKSVIKAISKFSKKHPKLTKVLTIMMVLFIVMIFTAQNAQASVNSNISDQDLINSINALIGFIEEISNDPNIGFDKQVSSETLSYLIDWKNTIKSGVDSNTSFDLSDNAQAMLNASKKVVGDMIKDDKIDKFSSLIEKGEKYISYSIKEIKNTSGSYTNYLIGKK